VIAVMVVESATSAKGSKQICDQTYPFACV
jgi:hypothetical protein